MKRWLVLLALALSAHAAAALDQTPTGFYYPTGSKVTASNWLQTSCPGDSYFGNAFHTGWDMGLCHDQPVYSIAKGTVRNITNTGNQDVTFIWVEHPVVDPANGNRFSVWAVYGHTRVRSGISVGSTVNGGDVIGYTIDYDGGDCYQDHVHLGINTEGWFTTTKNISMTYVKNNGQTGSATVTVGWGRGSPLPSDWCGHKDQNKATLPTRGFVDPKSFILYYRPADAVLPCNPDYSNLYIQMGGNGCGTSDNPLGSVFDAFTPSLGNPATIHIRAGSYPQTGTLDPGGRTVKLEPFDGAVTLGP